MCQTFLYGVITCLLLIWNTVFAATRPCPGQFVLTGEWVYLHPIIDSPYYVIDNLVDSDDQQVGTRKANELSYHSGFRIESGYGFCDSCTDIRLSWTYLSTDDSESTSGPFLHATQGLPDAFGTKEHFNGTALSKIKIDFNEVEGVFGFHLYQSSKLRLTLESGLQYADFDVNQRVDYVPITGSTAFVQQDLQYWGIGPQFGLDFSYHLWNCLSFVGVARGALLVGETDSKYIMIENGDNDFADAKNETLWRIVPNTHMRLGLNYQMNCWCKWNVEMGYEFLAYFRVIDSVVFPDSDAESLSYDLYSNVDFHGPYVALNLTF